MRLFRQKKYMTATEATEYTRQHTVSKLLGDMNQEMRKGCEQFLAKIESEAKLGASSLEQTGGFNLGQNCYDTLKMLGYKFDTSGEMYTHGGVLNPDIKEIVYWSTSQK